MYWKVIKKNKIKKSYYWRIGLCESNKIKVSTLSLSISQEIKDQIKIDFFVSFFKNIIWKVVIKICSHIFDWFDS